MEKYKNYMLDKFDVWQVVIAILCAAVVLFAIIAEMGTPVDFAELENHYAQLETIKQDTTNMHRLKNVDISIEGNSMTIRFNGKYHNLKAYFDENKNYVNATVEDNRIGSNIIVSIFAVLLAACFAYIATYLLLPVLYIPLFIHKLIKYIKKKWQGKKQNK